MAEGEASKLWVVPSDFGKALEGFTRMLGAPGEDGVFRYEPSPDDGTVSRPAEDDGVEDWFDTSSDPEIAKQVAAATAAAQQEVPPVGSDVPPVPGAEAGNGGGAAPAQLEASREVPGIGAPGAVQGHPNGQEQRG